jgi:hypothetical protein
MPTIRPLRAEALEKVDGDVVIVQKACAQMNVFSTFPMLVPSLS